jgi:DNA-directed RNA polymerase specialized sigma24 family protein
VQFDEYPGPAAEIEQGVTPMVDTPAAPPTSPRTAAAIEPLLRSLWRYLRMHGASTAEAEDLAQEAFVLALQKGALDAEPAATEAFLQRSARFLFLRLRRAGQRQRAVADAVDALWVRDGAADGGDALVAAARLCVDQLDGRARTAVELSYGIGDAPAHSRAQIAQVLGMQENGVKTLMQRVRQRLRECIERRLER